MFRNFVCNFLRESFDVARAKQWLRWKHIRIVIDYCVRIQLAREVLGEPLAYPSIYLFASLEVNAEAVAQVRCAVDKLEGQAVFFHVSAPCLAQSPRRAEHHLGAGSCNQCIHALYQLWFHADVAAEAFARSHLGYGAEAVHHAIDVEKD